jgi:glycine dehydrogenase subunit 1
MRHFSTSLSCAARNPSSEINEFLLENGILGGYDLSQDYPQLENSMLLAVTEMNSKDDIDLLVSALVEVSQ